MIKNILFLIAVLFVSSCISNPNTIEKMIANAKCVDSIKVVPQNEYAVTKDFQIRGLTLSDVKRLYGNTYFVGYENVNVSDLNSDISGYYFTDIFKEEDFPLNVSLYYWIRNARTLELMDKVEDVSQLLDYKGDLGMCLSVYFVKYNNELIAIDAIQSKFEQTFSKE